MKKILVFLGLIILVYGCQYPAKYNDTIVETEAILNKQFNKILYDINNDKPELAQQKLPQLQKDADSCLQVITQLKKYRKNTTYQKTALDLIQFYKKSASNYFPAIIAKETQLLKDINNEFISNEFNQLYENMENEGNQLFLQLQKEQIQFAKENDFATP